MRRFLRTMSDKLEAKAHVFPGKLDLAGMRGMRTFAEFDQRFTAPLHGFTGAEDYWARASSRQFLPRIRVPTLLVNARDDPFLAGGCYPTAEAEQSRLVHLELPESGGHVGFITFNARDCEYWSETRAAAFLDVATRPESGIRRAPSASV
jgi:predicted alpha/beta-fold hydrolase